MRLTTLLISAILMTSQAAFSQVNTAPKNSASAGSGSGAERASAETAKSASTSTPAPSPSPAAAPTPATSPTGKLPTHAEDVTIPPLPNAWSFFVYLQGVENGAGLGVGVETPKAWDLLSGRFSLVSDRYRDRTPANRDLDFLTAQAAMKLYLAPRASQGIGSYVLAGLNHHFVYENTDGSRTGIEVLYGIEFNQYVADSTMSQVAVQGAFIELGTTYAGVTNEPAGVRIRDGFIARLGFKTYF